MKNRLKYILAAVGLVCAIITVAILPKNKKKAEEMSSNVLNSFYNAVLAGDFEQADKLCTPELSDYMEALEQKWEESAILSETTLTINSVEGDAAAKTFFYTLELPNGRKKGKIATLRKEEGEWKIISIIDNN